MSRAKALVVLFLVLAALVAAMTFVGPGETLDKKLWYSAATAEGLLEALGPAGRVRYLHNELLDLVFLLVYSLFAYIALRRWRLLAFLPGVFDLAETSLVIRVLSDYPADLSRRLSWLCFLTPAKWCGAALLAAFVLYEALPGRLRLWRLFWPLRAWLRPGAEVGSCFPDFTLRDLSGREHSLYDGRPGALTLLWLTNLCGDCRARIPLLEEARLQSQGRLRVLAVSILAVDDPLPAEVAPGCGFPILLDPADVVGLKLGQAHPPGTCPMRNIYIVDGDGTIRFKHHLSAIAPEEFRSVWRKLALLPVLLALLLAPARVCLGASSSARLEIVDIDDSLAVRGSSRRELPVCGVDGKTAERRAFIERLWKRYSPVFGQEDWRSFGPDSSYRRITLAWGEKKIVLESWHPIVERAGTGVAMSYGVTGLGGRTREEMLKTDDALYVKRRKAFDAIARECAARKAIRPAR